MVFMHVRPEGPYWLFVAGNYAGVRAARAARAAAHRERLSASSVAWWATSFAFLA